MPRQYNILFEAKEEVIVKGECTKLKWRVEGASSVVLEGDSVALSGEKKVCPKSNTTYRLAVQLLDGTQLSRTTKITVEEEEDKN